MIKRTTNIVFITLFAGFAFLAQPAIAAECAEMMRCMPGHTEGHMPGAEDTTSCDCVQSTQILLRIGCMPQNRSQIAPDINISSHIDYGIPLQHDSMWICQDWLWTEHRFFTAVDPVPHCPIFILNQSFLC